MRISLLALLPADVATRFPDDPSGKRGAPHITVLHVDSDHPDSVRPQTVREVIAQVAAAGAPLTVELLDEVEYFGDDGDELRAAALLVGQSWGLRFLRLAVRLALREAGVETPQRFETFEPHATQGYWPEGVPFEGPRTTGLVDISVLQLRVDGGEPETFHLGEALTGQPPSERLSGEFDRIRGAIRRRHKMSFTYTRGTGERTSRTVRPIDLEREDAGWVLGAFCELRQAFRTFRLDRITSLEVLDVTFEQMQARPAGDPDATMVTLRALRFGDDLVEEAERRVEGAKVPQGWVIGQPFRTVASGEIFCRWTGKRRGKPISESDLHDAVRIFETGEDVGVDKDHKTKHPDGAVLAMWVVDDGDRQSLAVVPAYGPRMAKYVADSSGSLWSSPELIWTEVHDPRTGDPVGRMRVHSLAITADPAQAHRVLDRVCLTDDGGPAARRVSEGEESRSTPPEEEHDVEEVIELLKALIARFDAQEAQGQMADGDKPEEGEGAAEAAEAAEAEDYADEKFSALRAEIDQLKRDKVVGEMLSSGRIAPAEKAAAEKCFEKGGDELVREVYGSRKPQGAVPALKGHGQATEADAQTTRDEAADKLIRERMSADTVPYHVAAMKVCRERPELFQAD